MEEPSGFSHLRVANAPLQFRFGYVMCIPLVFHCCWVFILLFYPFAGWKKTDNHAAEVWTACANETGTLVRECLPVAAEALDGAKEQEQWESAVQWEQRYLRV